MTSPLITTVIPTYRRPKLLRRAIQSVLNQTYPNFQVWIFDNASDDETSEVVAELVKQDSRVKYHCHPSNIGMIPNFNYALKQVKTPFFSLLCDDDLLLSTFYQTTLACFDAHPDAVFVSTSVVIIDDEGSLMGKSPAMSPGYYKPPTGLLSVVKYSKAPLTGTLYRQNVIDQIGGYDEEIVQAADLDYDLRIATRFPFAISAEVGAGYAAHQTTTSAQAKEDVVWLDLRKIIYKITNDENVPLDIRSQAGNILSRGLETYMFNLGIVQILRADFEGALKIGQIFRSYYHRLDKALFLIGLSYFCQYVPPAYRLAKIAQKIRKHTRKQEMSKNYDELHRQLAWIRNNRFKA